MPDQPSILFYTGTQPGAQPFVRVPTTPEGLRYAGYLARYKTSRPDVHGFYVFAKTAVPDIGAGSFHVQAGWFGYPKEQPIPLGTERWIVDIDGDSAWSTFTGAPAVGDIMAPSGWVPVPEGAPPVRP